GEALDVVPAVNLGNAHERALAELREVGRDVLAAEDPASAERAVDLGDAFARPRKVDDELLEEAVGEDDADAADLAQPPGGVVTTSEDQAPELGETLRPKQRHVGGVRDRMQVDRIAGPVVPFLAAAVGRLLEERDAEAVLAGHRLGDAEAERRVLPRVARLVPRRDEPARAAAGRHLNPPRLD